MIKGTLYRGKYILPLSQFLEGLSKEYRPIICLDCALAIHGLSSFNGELYPMIFSEVRGITPRFCEGIISEMFVPQINYSNISEYANGKAYVTSPERSICDMIIYDRDNFFTLEAIDEIYSMGQERINRLETLAKEYSIYDKLIQFKDEAEDLFYNY